MARGGGRGEGGGGVRRGPSSRTPIIASDSSEAPSTCVVDDTKMMKCWLLCTRCIAAMKPASPCRTDMNMGKTCPCRCLPNSTLVRSMTVCGTTCEHTRCRTAHTPRAHLLPRLQVTVQVRLVLRAERLRDEQADVLADQVPVRVPKHLRDCARMAGHTRGAAATARHATRTLGGCGLNHAEVVHTVSNDDNAHLYHAASGTRHTRGTGRRKGEIDAYVVTSFVDGRGLAAHAT